jgi:hypothetical protein
VVISVCHEFSRIGARHCHNASKIADDHDPRQRLTHDLTVEKLRPAHKDRKNVGLDDRHAGVLTIKLLHLHALH